MSEEEKKAIEYLKVRLYGNEGCELIDVAQSDLRIIIKLVERVLKDDKNWQEIYDEQEENIREKNNKICEFEFIIEKQQKELEQEKEKNKEIAIKNRALKEESNACGEQIVSLDNQLKEKEQEIEYLKSQIPSDKIFYYSDKDYIRKDKIKEKIRLYKAVDNPVSARVLELLLEEK